MREERKRLAWAGPQGIKEGVGRAQLEKKGEKELHLNTFKFEFKT
jgi:hypothetical protein